MDHLRIYSICFLWSQISFAQGLLMFDCDNLYAKRGLDLFKASACYSQLEKNKIISSEIYFERAFTTLSSAVSEFVKKPEERKSIDEALLILDQVKNKTGEHALYNYWKAVWISFDAVEKDRGSLLPTTMFGRIGTIQDLLAAAIKEDPSIHFFGPERVLGLMHTQMPKIAGGDKKYAEQLLKSAFTNQPRYFSNVYNYANILYLNGKTNEAKKVLTDFVNSPDAYYEIYAPEIARSLLPEIKNEKIKAQKLITEIDSE